MKKLICLIASLLLILSTVVLSSAADINPVNVLHATDYYVDQTYTGDSITVEYSFPLNPYADVWAWNSNGFKLYLGGVSGNPLSFDQYGSFNAAHNSILYNIYPLGFTSNNGQSLSNVIDLTELKKGSEFSVHFSFDINITEQSLFNYNDLSYCFNLVDENLNIVEQYKIPLDIHMFEQIGDFSQDGNTYRYKGQLRFTKPASARYVLPFFDTDWLDFTLNDSLAEISFEFNYFNLYVDISAFEENSKALQQIQNSIDSGFTDVNNNLNDIENVLKDDPNHTPDTSPLKDDLNELEDLEGEINEEINKPIELPDGSELEVGGSTLIDLKDWWRDYFDAPEYEATAGKLYAKIFESFMPFLGTPIFFSLLLGLIIAFLTGKRSS